MIKVAKNHKICHIFTKISRSSCELLDFFPTSKRFPLRDYWLTDSVGREKDVSEQPVGISVPPENRQNQTKHFKSRRRRLRRGFLLYSGEKLPRPCVPAPIGEASTPGRVGRRRAETAHQSARRTPPYPPPTKTPLPVSALRSTAAGASRQEATGPGFSTTYFFPFNLSNCCGY